MPAAGGAGDEIVLASTDFDPRQAERRTIAAIGGNTITLDRPLEYMHFGEITFGVDERGEVGLLTRNIRIQASDDAESSYFGGHIMAMAGSQDAGLGRRAHPHGPAPDLARYPIHWHLIGEGAGPVHPQLLDPRHLQPLRDGARHQQPAGREQRHLQHRRPLLLPRGRDRDRQPVRPQPRHPDQVSPDPAVRADQPWPQRRGPEVENRGAGQASFQAKYPDPFGQHRLDASGSPTRTTLPRQRGRGVRPDRLLVRLAGAPERASSKAPRSAPRPGRAGRRCASSAATPPTPTSTA